MGAAMTLAASNFGAEEIAAFGCAGLKKVHATTGAIASKTKPATIRKPPGRPAVELVTNGEPEPAAGRRDALEVLGSRFWRSFFRFMPNADYTGEGR